MREAPGRLQQIGADLAEDMPTLKPVRIDVLDQIPGRTAIYSRTTREASVITCSRGLFAQLSEPAAGFAIAHELAHLSPAAQRRRRPMRLAWAIGAVAGVALWLLFDDAIWPARLAVALLCMFVVAALVSAWWNRREEYECDRIALEHTHDPRGATELLAFLKQRHRSRLVDLLGRHPTPADRAAHLGLEG